MKLNHCIQGDCLDIMRGMADNSVDSIVTDPPYGLSFMGRHWDYDVPTVAIWREALRVLKPGGHLLAFAGTRTQHRMCVNIEDAGFEIRDMIAWLYGSGFPKSKNLDGDWQGWGTALKPAMEPITIARKPLTGTVSTNVLQHGVGALNIDGCRVEVDVVADASQLRTMNVSQHDGEDGWGMNTKGPNPGARVLGVEGRWPANVIHDGSDEVLAGFPDSKGQHGDLQGCSKDRQYPNGCFGKMAPASDHAARGDTGTAARFFYCAKASRKDRNDGLRDGTAPAVSTGATMRECEEADWTSRNWNHHPTVKPTDLMRYLCRLITPPDGVVLDPFTGSGSTGKAAVLEGFSFIGIEREAEFVGIANARISAAIPRQARMEFA